MNEAILAYENKVPDPSGQDQSSHALRRWPDGTIPAGTVESTLGRFIFNEILPQDLGFVDRTHSGKCPEAGS